MPRRGSGSTRSRCASSLWASDIRFAVLPARFNTRRHTWLHHWFTSVPRPVILHTNRYHPTKFGPVRAWLDGLSGPYR